jgi:hypothetical protein
MMSDTIDTAMPVCYNKSVRLRDYRKEPRMVGLQMTEGKKKCSSTRNKHGQPRHTAYEEADGDPGRHTQGNPLIAFYVIFCLIGVSASILGLLNPEFPGIARAVFAGLIVINLWFFGVRIRREITTN